MKLNHGNTENDYPPSISNSSPKKNQGLVSPWLSYILHHSPRIVHSHLFNNSLFST